MTKKEKFTLMFQPWEATCHFGLNPNFYEDVMEARRNMPVRIDLPKVDMNTYKRAIIHDIFQNINSYEVEEKETIRPTEQELEANRFLDGEYKGRKVTRVLTELSRQGVGRNNQKLDFFHKLRNDKNEYYITSDPTEIVEGFVDIETCFSPDGENKSVVVSYLASPHTYMAKDKFGTVRMTIYADMENKKVFLHGVYGSYDYMFSLAVVNYFVEEGFSFSMNLGDYFDVPHLEYTDAILCSFEENIKFLGGKTLGGYHGPMLNIWTRPDGEKDAVDIVTGDASFFEGDHYYTTATELHTSSYGHMILTSDSHWCGECDGIVDSHSYDYDYEMCSDCAGNRNWCEDCGEFIEADYYNFEVNACDFCADRTTTECLECHLRVRNEVHNDYLGMCDSCVDEVLVFCDECQEHHAIEDYSDQYSKCKGCVADAKDSNNIIRLGEALELIPDGEPYEVVDALTGEKIETKIVIDDLLDVFVTSLTTSTSPEGTGTIIISLENNTGI